MADLNVTFLHPVDGRTVQVELDGSMTAEEAIGELTEARFLEARSAGYSLAKKGGHQLESNISLEKAGIQNGDIIRVIPSTDAGGPPEALVERKPSAVPGLSKSASDNFTIKDIQRSPEAVVMMVHLYDDLKDKSDKQAQALETERLRANDRFGATVLLFMSQFILSIGASLLTQNSPMGTPVIVTGGVQAIVALYLTFRKPGR